MAQNIHNDKDIALGGDYPIQLTGQSGGFKQTFITLRDVTSQIHILLRTQIGERINNPEYGTNLNRLLFESYQTEDELVDVLRQNIEEPIRRWITPPVVINNVDIIFEDYNRAAVSIDFSLEANPEENSKLNLTINGQ